MNRREMKCGKTVLAICAENSVADCENKLDTCVECGNQSCAYFVEYVDDYIHACRRVDEVLRRNKWKT